MAFGGRKLEEQSSQQQVKDVNVINEIIGNQILVCGIAGWACAQICKTILYAVLNHEIRWERLIGDGGMPSGHSATVMGMATASARLYGFGSFEFAISCMLAIIVMHDAMGVRLETGKQGKVLNEIIDFLNNENLLQAFQKTDKVYQFWEASLKEFVGHTPSQVVAGALLGVLVSIIII